MPINVGNIEPVSREAGAQILSSPVAELLAAVHFLAEKKHHELNPSWARDMLSELSPGAVDTVRFLNRQNWAGMAHYDYLLTLGELEDIGEFVRLFRSLPIERFLYITFNQEIPEETIREVRKDENLFEGLYNSLSWIVSGEYEAIKYVLYHGEKYRNDLAALFLELDGIFFRNKRAELTGVYEEAMREIREQLRVKTPLEVMSEIKGHAVIEAEGYTRFIFVPCYFLHIHNILCFSDSTILLLFSTKGFFRREVKAELYAEHIKALADKTRLEILNILRERPAYGKQIAGILNLTGATISRHLNLLRTFGFIKEERREGVKYFSLREGALEKFFSEMKDFLVPSKE